MDFDFIICTKYKNLIQTLCKHATWIKYASLYNLQACKQTVLQEIIRVLCFATRVHVQEEVDAVNEKIRQRRASKEDILIAAIYIHGDCMAKGFQFQHMISD